MSFDEVLAQVRELLEREGRVAYRILKRRFELDDEDLEDLKADLIEAKRVAVDEDGKVLVWVGEGEQGKRRNGENQFGVRSPESGPSSAERRQLTVMFCDLGGSTALSEQLDPEELREVVRLYQEVCGTVIHRFAGYIARYVGDSLLVYFGYPVAHEDDAQRAVRAGLGIIAALPDLNTRSQTTVGATHASPLQVRIGIHTGLVVVGELGGGEYREQMALGDTPNIAAHLQGLAEPDVVVISAATSRLIEGFFACQDLGLQTLKGVSVPLRVYHVLGEGPAPIAAWKWLRGYRSDPARGPGAGSRAVTGALGAGERRAGAGGAAQWGGGHWQIPAAAGAQRAGGERSFY